MNQTFDHGLSTPQLQTLKTILNQCPSVVEKVSVFGSRATATYKSYSDIDLVLYGSISEDGIDRLWTLFNESNLPYKVDINAYHLIHYPPLKRHIDQFSKVLFTQDELDSLMKTPKPTHNQSAQALPSGWREYRFSEFVQINPQIKLQSGQEYPFVEMKDLNENRKKAYSKQIRKLKGGSRFVNGDTLFARITPCLENGKICQVDKLKNKQGFGSTEFLVFRGENKVSHPNFIYYLSRWQEVRSFAVLNMSGTSGRQRVSKEAFNELVLALPPLPEQKAIAEVLSSLDDKIDLLHRQNKTLEDMAQALFRKWFIDEAQEDWEEKPLSVFGDIICGKTPSKKVAEYFGGTIPFIKIPDMHGNTFIFDTTDTLSEEGQNSQNNKTLPPKSICVSCIATVGLVSMNAFESQTNQQINSIIPKKEEYGYFIYLFVKSSNNLLHAMASGGTITMNLNTGNFAKIIVPTIDENLISKFHKVVKPIFGKIFSNQLQIRTLENLRDTLLPKLMSGAIRISI